MTITLTASDGYALTAELLEAAQPRATVLVAGAMGVPRRFYRRFAQYLAGEGFSCLLFDYRGIGDSAPKQLRGFEVTAVEWAEKDLAAAVSFLRTRSPELPTVFLGHSVGGQLLGLVPNARELSGAVFIASQSGHWRLWNGPRRLQMLGVWYIGIPVLTRLFGYLPMKVLGQGENLPLGVARQWATWGRHPKYVLSSGAAGYAAFDRPLRVFGFSDDWYAPERAVRELASFYEQAPREISVVSPSEIGSKSIGHFGAFSERFSSSLWPRFRDALADLAAAQSR